MSQNEIIKNFLAKNTQYTHVIWEDNDLTVYFKNSPEPFCLTEFVPDSPTRLLLETLITSLQESD